MTGERHVKGLWGTAAKYSDGAIAICLRLSYLLDIPLRGVQGLVRSWFRVCEIDLPVPHYSRLSRRAKNLDINLAARPKQGKIDVVIDATGLKVYGEGEWKTRQHGKEKRRTWRKLHLSSDPESFEIVGCELTETSVADGTMLPKLIEESDINNAYADGAYDWKGLHKKVEAKEGKLVAPPRGNAVISIPEDEAGKLTIRDKYIIEIEQTSLEEWKQRVGYHIRSLSETQFYRLKYMLSDKLRSRLFENQKIEAKLKAHILNVMTQITLPKAT